jgi:hypothetical protein
MPAVNKNRNFFLCSCSKNFLTSFWFKLKQQWTIEDISIFSNSRHLERRAGLSDTILKWDYPRTIPAKFASIQDACCY